MKDTFVLETSKTVGSMLQMSFQELYFFVCRVAQTSLVLSARF